MSTENTDRIRQYHHQFLSDNITNHETLPILKTRLVTTPTTPTTSINNDNVHTPNSTKHNTPAPPSTYDQRLTQVQPEPPTRKRPDQLNPQPTKPTTQRKRKQNETHPGAMKQLKLYHFLGQSSQHNPANT